MFFTPDLLARRDSGFGLLWLAATLGSKSSFKKLPKRSIVTADIPELCELIVEPPEPLALRLSSNLMIGVVRVYKVKQEILFTDVSTCFNTLRKAVQDLHASSNIAAQLQMGQPSVRADAITFTVEQAAFAVDFDHLFTAWDGVRPEIEEEDESDEEYGTQKTSKARKGKEAPVSAVGNARGESHTLKENHDLILSASFDNSFRNEGFGGLAPSSSHYGGFGFEDDFLGGLDNAGDIGDELAKELGEGWGAPVSDAGVGDLGGDMAMIDEPVPDFEFEAGVGEQEIRPPVSSARDNFASQANEMGDMDDGFLRQDGSVVVPLSPVNAEPEMQTRPSHKKKRVRLLLDARTELTNEELQKARAHYLEEQAALRREIAQKKAEKESEKFLEDMILGVPRGLHAPVLVDFWLENFRLQVEARSGKLHMDSQGEPPRKRRRIDEDTDVAIQEGIQQEPMDIDQPFVFDNGPDFGMPGLPDNDLEMDTRLRSSEEPGQARRASRPPSAIGGSQFGIEPFTQVSASQRSAVFPWDNAGVSSSVGGAFDNFLGSDRVSLPKGGRGSSLSSRGRDSPMHLGLADEFGGRENQFDSDGFEFAVPGDKALQEDTQKSDMNFAVLERNSLNFLEYAKMQLNAMPVPTSTLSFDDVVPKATSTPHVAAAAFYHCLVLATKNLISVAQKETFGPVNVTVK